MADFAIVQQAIRTTAGTQDYTVAGFGTPKAALFFVTYGTVNGTVTQHGGFGMGATDGTNQWAVEGFSQDAIVIGATFSRCRAGTSDCLILSKEDASVEWINAQWSAWIVDGIRINVSIAPPSALLVTCVLIGGSGVSNAYVGTIATPTLVDTGTATVAPNFQPDAMITASGAGTAFNYSYNASMNLALGVVQRGASNPHTQKSVNIRDISADTPMTEIFGATESAMVFRALTSASGAKVEIQDFTSQGFSAFLRNSTGTAQTIAYIALKFSGLTAKVLSLNSPTSGGAQAFTGVGSLPQFGLLLQSAETAEDTRSTDDTGEVFGVGVMTAAAQYTAMVTSDDNVATTNAECVTHSRPVFIRKDSGTFMDATFSAFNSDGVTLSYGTANGTTRKWAGLFISAAVSTEYTAATTQLASGGKMIGLRYV